MGRFLEHLREHAFFYYLAGVPLLGIAAQWLAWRLRLPSILLLLGIGVAVGSVVNPDELLAHLANVDASTSSFGSRVLFPIVSLSVAVILFEGGLTLKFHELKEAGSGVLRLVTIGAMVSWALTTVAAVLLLDLNLRIAALVGAILVVTGPTVVAPMLLQIQPSRRIALFVIDEAKKLEICTLKTPVEPKAGQTIIALVEPIPDTAGGTGEEHA